MPYVKVGSTKASNRWDLGSQHVTPKIAYFLKVPIKAFIPAMFSFLNINGKNIKLEKWHLYPSTYIW